MGHSHRAFFARPFPASQGNFGFSRRKSASPHILEQTTASAPCHVSKVLALRYLTSRFFLLQPITYDSHSTSFQTKKMSSSATPSQANEKTKGTPAKEVMSSHADPVSSAFMEGKILSDEDLKCISRDIKSVLRLKKESPVVSLSDAATHLLTWTLTIGRLFSNRWATIAL